jgi:hypothetical protein
MDLDVGEANSPRPAVHSNLTLPEDLLLDRVLERGGAQISWFFQYGLRPCGVSVF